MQAGVTRWALGLALPAVVSTSATAATLRVNEDASRLRLFEDRCEARLVVNNATGVTVELEATAELVDPSDHVWATGQARATAPTGLQPVDVVLTPGTAALDLPARRQMLFYRLRYRLELARPPAGAPRVIGGIVAASRLTPDVFELRLLAPNDVHAGQPVRAIVRAAHPVSARPASGVSVEAALVIDAEGGKRTVKLSRRTDWRGLALFDFSLPTGLGRVAGGEIEATGRRAGVSAIVSTGIRFFDPVDLRVSTDKPLYRPGQTLRVRILARGRGGRALAGAKLALTIEDGDGEEQFAAALTTSRFGVASVDWPIPEQARLGTYRVQVRTEEDDEEDGDAYRGTRGAAVRVSRYELPQFAIRAEPDRAYYLSGQNAQVTVRADYLFGKPVTRGRVRVVLEADRSWDSRAQRWDVEERESREGELDESGRYRATFDLASDHADLAGSYSGHLRDIDGTAYVTDSTTGRTEERGFTLRVTRDPIHVYIAERHGEPCTGAEGRICRASFYVSTFYADGAPAACEVRIARQLALPQDDERDEDELEARGEMPSEYLATVHTNRYGVGKVADLKLPAPSGGLDEDAADAAKLVFYASDREGRRGHITDRAAAWGASRVLVETRRTIHAIGEPIEAEIRSSSVPGPFVVEVRSATQVLSTRIVSLSGGSGAVTFPYTADYRGALGVVAYPVRIGERYDHWGEVGARGVVYPTGSVQVNVTADRAEYRPGQEATLRFALRGDDGRPAAGVVGLVVLDKALEERVATERGVPRDAGFLGAFREGSEGLGGVTVRDLLALDMARPLPEGLDLVAEILVRQVSAWYPEAAASDAFDRDVAAAFSHFFKDQLAPLVASLERRFPEAQAFPDSVGAVRSVLAAEHVAFDAWRDPWQQPYRLVVEPRADRIWVDVVSAGPDKLAQTPDDIVASRQGWRYFLPHGNVVQRATDAYYVRHVEPIRDLAVLRSEIAGLGEKVDAWRDPWGERYAYEYNIGGPDARVVVKSAGPNRAFEPPGKRPSDDVIVWTARNRYFTRDEARIEAALEQGLRKTAIFPRGDEGWAAALDLAGLRPDALLDPWGRAYDAVFRSQEIYATRIRIMSYTELKARDHRREKQTPVSRTVEVIELWSRGPDGQKGGSDDFQVASFRRNVAERESAVTTPAPGGVAVFESGTGAIGGTVKDLSGGVVAGAGVVVTSYATGVSSETRTDASGRYLIQKLAPGYYRIAASRAGFRKMVVTRVPVQNGARTEVDIELEVAAVEEAVEVRATVPSLQASSGERSYVIEHVRQTQGQSQAIATPRVRKRFPETLYWEPALETDARGRASVRVPLADAVTTWKVAAIASTEDGAVAIAERELLAFQPFFVDNAPPPILTAGDAIGLPALVRNYTDKPLWVDVSAEAGDGLAIGGARQARVSVAKNDSARAVFDLKAGHATKQGRVRFTATSAPEGDAVEKTVAVHPDGAETETGQGVLVDREAALELNVPEYAIAGSLWSELRIAPNLATHVLESVEAVMRRPSGCAEQAISAAYPSLMALRLLEGRDDKAGLSATARRYLDVGYRGLLEYQDATGGFAYFHQREPDVALTAYALRFLGDLRAVHDVDDAVIDAARRYLLGKQAADGSWPVRAWSASELDEPRTAALTALVARALGLLPAPATGEGAADGKRQEPQAAALDRAFQYLDSRVGERDDPYFLASYVLAAASAKSPARVAKALARLRPLARQEKDGLYWAEEINTPFYGWGAAGRIEQTALVLRAFAVGGEAADATLIDGGLLFLLQNRDRYGIWWSGQATVNVLDAITSLIGASHASEGSATLDVLVNGRAVQTLALPTDADLTRPLTVDLSAHLAKGTNRIELRRPQTGGTLSAQAVANYYVPWPQAALRTSDALRLDVRFDKRETTVGDTINVHVEAERVGFRGYGMLLGEIGLPPGVDVDRESLERAVAVSGWGFCRYEIQPDRVVVYLWPRAGGVAFDFTIRPRLAMKAQSAASKLSDYYNPDAQVVVPPLLFEVAER